MKNKLLICAIVSALFFCFGTFASTKTTANENVIRLHVIANSDSEADQAVKLLVRDAILDSFSAGKAYNKKEDAEKFICENLEKAVQIANEVLKENGFDYTAHAEYGIYDFPVRTYGDITLPAGKYYGLRIRLGESDGQNWWCVMYPPLCYNDATTNAKSATGDKLTFEIKFKITELWNFFK